MSDAVLLGAVTHVRRTVPAHRFRYRLGLLRLDLDQIERTFTRFPGWSFNRSSLGSVRRRDYLRGGVENLAEAARDQVEAHLGIRPQGRIELLTQPRCLGTGFNPLNLYRCHDRDDRLQAIIVEVNNTPWGEQIAYVLATEASAEDDLMLDFSKGMHVSPFQPMDFRYRLHWKRDATREDIRLVCWQDEKAVFVARMELEAQPLGVRPLTRLLLRNGLIPARVLLAIHWEALRLWFKRARYYPHPGQPDKPEHPLSSH